MLQPNSNKYFQLEIKVIHIIFHKFRRVIIDGLGDEDYFVIIEALEVKVKT